MKKVNMLDETRIYEENGEVKVRHILHESSDISMKAHPTECRVFIKDGKVISILSEEITKNGYTSLEICRNFIKEKIRKIYEMNNAL